MMVPIKFIRIKPCLVNLFVIALLIVAHILPLRLNSRGRRIFFKGQYICLESSPAGDVGFMPPLILCKRFQLKASNVLHTEGANSNQITSPKHSLRNQTNKKEKSLHINVWILKIHVTYFLWLILLRIDPAMEAWVWENNTRGSAVQTKLEKGAAECKKADLHNTQVFFYNHKGEKRL